MKKYLVLMSVTAVFCLSILFYGSSMDAATPKVTLHTVATEEVTSSISCEGVLEEGYKREVFLTTPVLASDVKVAIGQTVKSGERIADIDKEATQSILASASQGLSQEVLSSLGSSGMSDYSDILSASGTAKPKTEEIPTAVYAPISGVVTNIALSENELTSPSQSILTISDLSRMKVTVSVPENEIAKIKVGQSAVITGSGFEEREYQATVESIYPTARQKSSATGSESVVDVVLSVREPDEYLKPNFTATAKITTGQVKEVVSVPYEAVRQDDNGQEYVYIYSAGSALRRDIVTGLEFATGVEAVSGLHTGERVIENPDSISSNGIRVSLSKAGENQ